MNQLELLAQAVGTKIGESRLLVDCPSVKFTLCDSTVVCFSESCTSHTCLGAFTCDVNDCHGFNCPGFNCAEQDTCRLFGGVC